jgi:hypothetical protein
MRIFIAPQSWASLQASRLLTCPASRRMPLKGVEHREVGIFIPKLPWRVKMGTGQVRFKQLGGQGWGRGSSPGLRALYLWILSFQINGNEPYSLINSYSRNLHLHLPCARPWLGGWKGHSKGSPPLCGNPAWYSSVWARSWRQVRKRQMRLEGEVWVAGAVSLLVKWWAWTR